MVAHRRRQDLVERPEQSLHQIRLGGIRRDRRRANHTSDAQLLVSADQPDALLNSPLYNFINLLESTEANDAPIPNLISYSPPPPPSPESIIISSDDDSNSVQIISNNPLLNEEPFDPFEIYNFAEEVDLDDILDPSNIETVLIDELCSYIDDPNVFPPELYIELQEILNNTEDLLQ
ncbi:unnamed protein product [Lasius platythorax]|uniref:Uncharacterized protein n=1 Tax=Lasius platythorax TaxID=488582 RepID=A0AAV2MZL1_9HYME